MNPIEFVKSRQKQITLPSGFVVTVRKIEMADLLGMDEIPAPLLAMIEKSETSTKLNPREWSQLLDVYARASLVVPSVGDVTDETHIAVFDLPASDKQYIYAWQNEDAADIAATFPKS